MPEVVEVAPGERFKSRSGFKKGAQYYHCPNCGHKTRINCCDLNTWDPTPSPFHEDLQAFFGEKSSHTAYYDFSCKGCDLSVRLAYWEQETGMGGSWYPCLKSVFEVSSRE